MRREPFLGMMPLVVLLALLLAGCHEGGSSASDGSILGFIDAADGPVHADSPTVRDSALVDGGDVAVDDSTSPDMVIDAAVDATDAAWLPDAVADAVDADAPPADVLPPPDATAPDQTPPLAAPLAAVIDLKVSETHPNLFRVPASTSDPSFQWPAKRWKRLNCHVERSGDQCPGVAGPLIMWGWSGTGVRDVTGTLTSAPPDVVLQPGEVRSAYYGYPSGAPAIQFREWALVFELEWWTGSAGAADSLVRNYVFGWNGDDSATHGVWMRSTSGGAFDGLAFPGITAAAAVQINDTAFYERMPGRAGVYAGPASERAFIVAPMDDPTVADASEFAPYSAPREAYCYGVFHTAGNQTTYVANEATYNRAAYNICRDAPELREVVQAYSYPNGTWGCERMVYAYGYLDILAAPATAAGSLAVARWMRNGELLWGTWVSRPGTVPDTWQEADAKCPWSSIVSLLSYTGVYKMGNGYYFDDGTNGPVRTWHELKEGASCISDIDCQVYAGGGSSYACSDQDECTCVGTAASCP